MARSYNDGGFWMRPEWFGLIAGQSDENAGKLIKQMIITVENDGNPGEIPAKLAQNRVKIGMAWGTIFPKLREQILGRKNGKKGGNPAFSENGGSNPPGEPPVQTPGSNGGLEPNVNTLHDNTSLSCLSVNQDQSKGTDTTDKREREVIIPTLKKAIVYGTTVKHYSEEVVKKWYSENEERYHFANVRNGMPWTKSLDSFVEKDIEEQKRKAPMMGTGYSSSFDTDEFLALAMKRPIDK